VTGARPLVSGMHHYRPRFGFAVTLLAAIAVPLGLVWWVGWPQVHEAAATLGVLPVVAVLMTSVCNYMLRFLRWQGFMHVLGHHVPWRQNLPIYLSGLAFTASPGKAGELVRGIFLRHHGVPYSRAFLLFYWDRLSDLAGVLLLAATMGGLLASGYRWLMPGVLLVLVVLWTLRPGGPVFLRVLVLLKRRLPPRMHGYLRGLVRLRRADASLTPPLAFVGMLLGAAAYSFHGIGLYLLAQAAGATLGITDAILIVSVSTLMGAALLIPGGAGMVEVTSVALLSAYGIDEAQAVVLGIVHRLSTFWFAIALGAVCLISLGRGRYHAEQ